MDMHIRLFLNDIDDEIMYVEVTSSTLC